MSTEEEKRQRLQEHPTSPPAPPPFGGPNLPSAFPTFGHSGYPGMTLWDWYVGQALAGLQGDYCALDAVEEAIARADLLMQARKQRGVS